MNDALAVNVGTWRPDQGGSVTVGPFTSGGPAPSEFEIHLRTDPATGAGYEITWGYLGTYKIIVKWFANGNFTYILNDQSAGTQLIPGDVLKGYNYRQYHHDVHQWCAGRASNR